MFIYTEFPTILILRSEEVFFPNKYSTWYFNIITKALQDKRCKGKDYFESHHILPQSIFPRYKNKKRNPWNIVLLTPKEHYICHALLTKMCLILRHRFCMMKAFSAMNIATKDQRRYNGILYQYNRKSIIKWNSEKTILTEIDTDKERHVHHTMVEEMLSTGLFRRGRSISTKERTKNTLATIDKTVMYSTDRAGKISAKLTGKSKSTETKLKMSKSRTGMKYRK